MDVHVINVDGSGERMVTTGKSTAWSPDGGSLVFEDWESANSDIDVIAVDGSNRRPLFDSGGYEAGVAAPAWTPDGESVVFSSNRKGTSFAMDERGDRFLPAVPQGPSDLSTAPLTVIANWTSLLTKK